MGNAVAIAQADTGRALEWLTRLQPSQLAEPQRRAEALAAAEALSQPADMTWTLARVAALLSPYYEKDVPQGVRELEAEDWAEALGAYPEWAITAAVRWWKSEANPERRKRPLEGDIVARIKHEMRPVREARIKAGWGEKGIDPRAADEDRKPVSPERAAEILKTAGYQPKTFGGKN